MRYSIHGLSKEQKENLGLNISASTIEESPVPKVKATDESVGTSNNKSKRRVLPDGTILLPNEEPYDTTD